MKLCPVAVFTALIGSVLCVAGTHNVQAAITSQVVFKDNNTSDGNVVVSGSSDLFDYYANDDVTIPNSSNFYYSFQLDGQNSSLPTGSGDLYIIREATDQIDNNSNSSVMTDFDFDLI